MSDTSTHQPSASQPPQPPAPPQDTATAPTPTAIASVTLSANSSPAHADAGTSAPATAPASLGLETPRPNPNYRPNSSGLLGELSPESARAVANLFASPSAQSAPLAAATATLPDLAGSPAPAAAAKAQPSLADQLFAQTNGSAPTQPPARTPAAPGARTIEPSFAAAPATPAPADSPAQAPAPSPEPAPTLADDHAATPPSAATAGQWLRQARQASGMSEQALADLLKMPIARVQAIEADDWAALPDTTFARAMALGICRVLRVDSTPVLALLPKNATPHLAQTEGINQPINDYSSNLRHSFSAASDFDSSGNASRLQWLLAAALIVGALVIAALNWGPQWWGQLRANLPYGQGSQPGAMADPPPAPTAPPLPAPSPAPEFQFPTTPGAGEPDAPPAPIPPGPDLAQPGSANPTPAPAAQEGTSPADPAQGAAPDPAAPAPPPPPSLRITALAQLRVQVNDFQRNMAMEQVLQPGEVFEVSSTHLGVTIDHADAAAVQVHGRGWDITRFTRNNIARFEVK